MREIDFLYILFQYSASSDCIDSLQKSIDVILSQLLNSANTFPSRACFPLKIESIGGVICPILNVIL